MPTANPSATWAAAESDRAAHLYLASASRCGHTAKATTPAPVGPTAPKCPRCVRYQ